MRIANWAFVVCTLLGSGLAAAHDPTEGRVVLEPESNTTITGTRITYKFQLVDTKANKTIGDADLNIGMEKKLHFIVYDTALKEFQHVHPAFDGKLWSVSLSFAKSGKYWLWAQGVLKDGEEFTTPVNANVDIAGTTPWPTPPVLTDRRIGTSGNSLVTLSSGKLVAGQNAMLNVLITRTDGSLPMLTPYLGAFAHAVISSSDADALIHAHPMQGAHPNEGMLHLNFAEPGLYRLWLQYMDGGQLRTAELALEVF
jgi:hypothetical protein